MILYVNGDSYSSVSDGLTYADFLGKLFDSPVKNAAIAGSCNRRILRTSLRDLLELKKTYNDIRAVISLTFPLRTEIWDPDLIGKNEFVNDGEFYSIQTTQSVRWYTEKDRVPKAYSKYRGYATEWLRWYNIEAETVELLREILLLTSWCKSNNIRYVIVSGILQEPVDLNSPFIKSFYEEVSADPSVIDIFENSFTEWCLTNGHTPIDDHIQEIHGKKYIIGHHSEKAHNEFAQFLFDNYLGSQ